MRFAAALVIVAALAGGSGWAALDAQHATEVPAGGLPPVVATPLLSVRRVPEALLIPQRDAAVAAAVAAVPPRLVADSCLMVTELGRPLAEHQVELPLLPASTQKLLVGAVLLDLVGADAVFRTSAVASAAVVDGVVEGDLWIVGGGDPLLETDAYRARYEDPQRPSTRFESLADALVAAGVRRIAGSVIGDGGRYDSIRTVPSWAARYVEQVSAGPLSGLGVNDGLATFTPELVAVNPGVPAADPPAQTAVVLTELLVERGVEVGGRATSGTAPADAVAIAGIDSPPVSDVVAQMLRYSDNTTAELLLKEIGLRSAGEGSTAAGTATLLAALASWGVPTDGLAVIDGSGLDLGNRVTCAALVDLLDVAGPGSPLAASLATSGAPGTLQERLVGTAAEGRLHAKTGSLRHVAALAGFVESPARRTYSFAIISNVAEGGFIPDSAFALADELVLSLATLVEPQVTEAIEPLPVSSG